MSERGSFVTEYIYCPNCFEVVKEVLLGNTEYLCSTTIPSWEEGKELPVIAGKFEGLYKDVELEDVVCVYVTRLEEKICHKIRIGVISEDSSTIFVAESKLKEQK